MTALAWVSKRHLFYVLVCIGLSLAYTKGVYALAYIYDIHIPPRWGAGSSFTDPAYFPWLFDTTVGENAVFQLLLIVCLERQWPLRKLLGIAMVFAVGFGFLHGGVAHIFIQGVAGFFLCVLFLKTGALERDYFEAIKSTFLAHFFYDVIWVALIAVAGGTTV